MPRRVAVPMMERTAAKKLAPQTGTEAAGDLAVGRGGAQFALGAVVIGADLGMVEEGEQVAAQLAVALSQSLAMPVGGGKPHDGIELAFQALAVTAPGALGQTVSSPGQHEGPQQQRLHARGEDRIARLDGELAIAQLMRQADLPVLGMAPLRAVEVGDPDHRPVPVHHLAHDTGARGCGG